MTLNGRNEVTNPFDIRNTANHKNVSQNRTDLLRILLDGKMKCGECNRGFRSTPTHRNEMDYLKIEILQKFFSEGADADNDPDSITINLRCGYCAHEGEYSMSPNPFLDVDKIGRYGAMVAEARKGMMDKKQGPRFPTLRTMDTSFQTCNNNNNSIT